MGMDKGYKLKECSVCGKNMKKIWNNKCYSCYKKSRKFIQGRNPVILEKALNKVYKVRGYFVKKLKTTKGQINVPPVLVGYKVKLVVVEENDEEK